MPKTGTALFVLLVILASCSMPGTGVEGDEGSMAITVSDATDEDAASADRHDPRQRIDITGVGPGGKSFSQIDDELEPSS